MPRLKKRRCPTCERLMSPLGISTAGDKPVWGCPRCNTVYAAGKLKVPDTPRWKDDPRDKRLRPRAD